MNSIWQCKLPCMKNCASANYIPGLCVDKKILLLIGIVCVLG